MKNYKIIVQINGVVDEKKFKEHTNKILDKVEEALSKINTKGIVFVWGIKCS